MLRKALLHDWSAIREICCLTGKAGDPIAQDRWPFFAENWIGPYQRLRPQWTWVAEGPDSRVSGYLTGSPDTGKFELEKALFFHPRLTLALALKRYPLNADSKRYLKKIVGLAKNPERSFSENCLIRLRSEFPAHLHMNLKQEARKAGTGSELLEAFFSELRRQGIPGVHVHCGPKPIVFYERNGFRLLEKNEFSPGVEVYCLGKLLLS